MVKQSTKIKEPIQKKSIEDFKKSFGFGGTKVGSITSKNADKPMDWLVMPKGFQDALKLPGIPCGYVTTICGHSNTGKSTIINHAIISAQNKNLLPVIFDTENNFSFEYAKTMGMMVNSVYGDVEVEKIDEETSEINIVTENQITDWTGDFIYMNNASLAEKYGNRNYSTGKEEKTFRKTAVIEDIATCINELLTAQEEGQLDRGIVFIWDSVGSISCFKNYKSSIGNNMFDAGAIAQSFNGIINNRIPSSRKVSYPYINSLILVNKVWMDSMSAPMGPPSISLKGGETIFFGSRLIILCGGSIKSSIKKLSAVSKGEKYDYGIQTKVKVLKNQLSSPYNLTYQGEFCCTNHGIISLDGIDEYRKSHISEILKQLNELFKENNSDSSEEISESDVEFTEEEGVE